MKHALNADSSVLGDTRDTYILYGVGEKKGERGLRPGRKEVSPGVPGLQSRHSSEIGVGIPRYPHRVTYHQHRSTGRWWVEVDGGPWLAGGGAKQLVKPRRWWATREAAEKAVEMEKP